MTDQQNGPVDLLDHLLSSPRIVGQRHQRILDRVQRPKAATIELDDDLAPVGGATPEAMDKNDSWWTHSNAPLMTAGLLSTGLADRVRFAQ